MTVIAGFKSYEGVVICSDTQETIEMTKKSVPKLRFEPASQKEGSNADLAAAFCGASNDGPWVDKLIENAWESAQTSTSLDEACKEIENSIKEAYQEFGKIYQPGYCPTAELIYGIKMFDGTKLFSAYGPIVNENYGYHSSGIGYYMADFLAGRMYRDYLGLQQCVILAAYILFQAKEHVEGCGGQSHIAVLRNDGTSGMVDSRHIEAITELLKFADDETGRMLLEIANIKMTEQEVRKNTDIIVNSLMAVRGNRITQLKEHIDWWDSLFARLGGKPKRKGSFGLTMPSDVETSGSEP